MNRCAINAILRGHKTEGEFHPEKLSNTKTADSINRLGLMLSSIIACIFLFTLPGPKSSRKTRLITLIDSVKLVNVICLLEVSSALPVCRLLFHYSNFATAELSQIFSTQVHWVQFSLICFPLVLLGACFFLKSD